MMQAEPTVYAGYGYPMMPVQPQMGMYPPVTVPSGFSTPPGSEGEAIIVTNYNY